MILSSSPLESEIGYRVRFIIYSVCVVNRVPEDSDEIASFFPMLPNVSRDEVSDVSF